MHRRDQHEDEDYNPEDDFELTPEERASALARMGRSPTRHGPAVASAPAKPTESLAGSAPRVEEADPKTVSIPSSLAACPMPIASAAFGPPLAHSNHANRFPESIYRSGLFGARGEAAPATAALIKNQLGRAMTFQGELLGMRDRCAFELALSLAKAAGSVSARLPVNLRAFARGMGYATANGPALQRAWACFERLSRCHLEVVFDDGRRFQGALLGSANKEAGSRYFVTLDPALAAPMCAWDKHFKMDAGRRARLGSPLARWLHDFASTHAKECPVELKYLRELCAFAGRKKNFPLDLRNALEDLATNAPELLRGHALSQVGEDSDEWELTMLYGPETPLYEKADLNWLPPSAASQAGRRKPAL